MELISPSNHQTVHQLCRDVKNYLQTVQSLHHGKIRVIKLNSCFYCLAGVSQDQSWMVCLQLRTADDLAMYKSHLQGIGCHAVMIELNGMEWSTADGQPSVRGTWTIAGVSVVCSRTLPALLMDVILMLILSLSSLRMIPVRPELSLNRHKTVLE